MPDFATSQLNTTERDELLIRVRDGLGGIISGVVADYASLPSPASSYTGELWWVETASGGLLSWIGVYKYPKGIYSPNSSNVWELCPLNTKFSEDALTLVNITNWAEYFGFAFDIGEGDKLIYNKITYENKTGTQTATAPDSDGTNWAVSSAGGSELVRLKWIDLVNTWTLEPASQTYSGGDGEVYAYTYGSTVYYRFIPDTYDSTLDTFYTTFSDPTLSGVVATRGASI